MRIVIKLKEYGYWILYLRERHPGLMEINIKDNSKTGNGIVKGILVPLADYMLMENSEYTKSWETIEYDKDGGIICKIIDGVQTIENLAQMSPKLKFDVKK